jgi:hypothetical protein
MSKLPPFQWAAKEGGVHQCEWQGMSLEAWQDGRWWVHDRGTILAAWHEQAPGSDLDDAKRRAQGAAIALRKPLVNAEK